MGLFSSKKSAKQVSIYELVLAALDENGRLPGSFCLPDEAQPGALHFAPGAMDGIGVYHTAPSDKGEEAAGAVKILAKACKKMDDSVLQGLAAYLAEHRVVGLIDPLIELIRGGETGITPNALYPVGYELMTKGTDTESVKLGIAMLGLLDIEADPGCRKAILTLAKYDEFTLFSLVALSSWADSNALIFQLAKETHSWGKIHAVERLRPDTQEIKDWLIHSGCENEVMNAYLGLTCAEKGELHTYLERDDLDGNLLRGAGIILLAMLDEGPCAGISAYQQAGCAIGRYLHHAGKAGNLETLLVVLGLGEWLKDCGLPEKETLLASASAMMANPIWPRQVLAAVEQGDNLWQACSIAQQLDLDIAAPLLEQIRKNPLEQCGLLGHLHRSPEQAEQAIALYESVLPLSEIATGMGDEMGLGPGYKPHNCLDMVLQFLQKYPGKGLDMIKAGLGSPVVRNRNMALMTLEAWAKEGMLGQMDPGIPGLLRDLKEREVNDSVKERLEYLVGPV